MVAEGSQWTPAIYKWEIVTGPLLDKAWTRGLGYFVVFLWALHSPSQQLSLGQDELEMVWGGSHHIPSLFCFCKGGLMWPWSCLYTPSDSRSHSCFSEAKFQVFLEHSLCLRCPLCLIIQKKIGTMWVVLYFFPSNKKSAALLGKVKAVWHCQDAGILGTTICSEHSEKLVCDCPKSL